MPYVFVDDESGGHMEWVDDAIAADNIDVGGGWNPATGFGDQATAAGAASTGVTDQSGYGTGTWNPGASFGIESLLRQLGGAVKNTSGQYDLAKLLALGSGLYSASKSNNTSQPAGYQKGIPSLAAHRQAPGPGGKLSGNVTYTAKAEGGLLESGGFVIPADVVSHLGNGSSEAGLRLLHERFGAAPIKGHGDGMSDSIETTIDGKHPARVANEEARLTKDQVEAAGGAKTLYAMMDKIRQARTGTKKQGKQIDPSKFVPGGEVQGYADGGITAPIGTTGTEQNVASWAGPYVTNMLGKGQALSEMPYDQYQGPLTAGPSALQAKTFGGLQDVQFPGNYGKSFTDEGIASSYMNPYLKQVLDPQLQELQRQSQINMQPGLAKMTQSGGYGGSRQALFESEANRNLLQEQNKTVGQGYANAFDKAMGQFNTEQGQGRDLVTQLGNQGATQQGLEQADVAAQKAQFEEARANPYKMVQFQQSLLSGLPLAAQTYNQAPTNNLTQFAGGAKTVSDLLRALGVTTNG